VLKQAHVHVRRTSEVRRTSPMICWAGRSGYIRYRLCRKTTGGTRCRRQSIWSAWWKDLRHLWLLRNLRCLRYL